MSQLDKTVYTSGSFAFECFSDDGVLYQVERLKEYLILKVSNITQNVQKVVSLGSPNIESDLEFKQIRLNKALTGAISVNIDVYRGNDFIENFAFTEANIPYVFPVGTVIDPHQNQTNTASVELRINSNKAIDELFIICGKCYSYPVIELQSSY